MRQFVPALATLTIAAVAAACASSAAGPLPHVPSGFTIQRIANVPDARELAIAPNGDLIVGTGGTNVYLIQHADADGNAGAPRVFVSLPEAPAAGVALGGALLFVGTQFGVYRMPYSTGDTSPRSPAVKIATVRPSRIVGAHRTTTVAYVDGTLYASVGSSCNACNPEVDDTRATIQHIDVATKQMSPEAIRIRNAVALTINPGTSTLWAGVAGVDDLPVGLPYEIFDGVTLHRAIVDYGWPSCYNKRLENPAWPGSCSNVAVPRVIFPAYQTPIGAVFYPVNARGKYLFPERYRGGAFVTLHGSWHGPAQGLSGYLPPRVVFVAMDGDEPVTQVNWKDPNAQWSEFVGGYQRRGTSDRIGRPTGIAVGPQGSLFIADDLSGSIYRVRPSHYSAVTLKK